MFLILMLMFIQSNLIYDKKAQDKAQDSFLNFSSCHLCKYYQLTGRRSGFCNKLNVLVKGNWSSCSLGKFPFSIEIQAK